MEKHVVIAGGGPVGLWLAAELRLGGVPVTVLEERADVDQRSKALTIHPRTLEVLASRGVHEPFLAEGMRIPGGHFAVLDSRLDFRPLDTTFPFTLALPQARTEELFEANASALGARIQRRHRVTGFSERPESVIVQVEGPEGPYEMEAAYLVGCDGSRSVVRTTAGIEFPGTDSTVLGWLGDVSLTDPPPLGFSTFGQSGLLMVVPLPGGTYRLVGITPRDVRTDWPGDLELDELRATVTGIAGQDFGMHDPVWLSRFGNATRLAEHYRRGRILLAGDAAHQHFPAGGVGMNVGIQDAANLGWKLAATLRGSAADDLLDTYHAERHPVGTDLVEASHAQVALMTGFTPQNLALRSLLGKMIATQPSFSKALAERLTGLGVGYPPADPSAHPLIGTRAPDLSFANTDDTLFTLLRPARHVLLNLTGEDELFADPTAVDLVVHTGRLTDPPGEWSTVRAALVRPDGHVAWISTDPDIALAEAVDQAIGPTGPVRGVRLTPSGTLRNDG
ncbi:FAD-dependent monooxygenase [Streptomyces marokkonensis]|uniref:FAD-dependent monooxygenase n=1 Tax=Streptomyces marokkonensis TaxID=324855 RepID=A0ABW6QGB0_9ACTN